MPRRLMGLLLLPLLVPPPARAEWLLHGTPVGATAGSQYTAKAVSDGAGGAIVVWTDSRSGVNDIYVQRLDASGRALWTPGGRAVCDAANAQTYPAITADGAGGAVIAWHDERSGAGSDIYVQRINENGDPYWAANGFALCTATGLQSRPTLVSDMAGGAVVAWQDARGPTGYDIYAQRIGAAGAALWTANGVLLSNAALDQLLPVSAPSGVGGAIVAWLDYRSDPDGDIYFRAVSPTGVAYGTSGGVPACTAPQNQGSLQIVGGGSQADFAAYLVWEDARGGADFEVYAQHVTNSAMVLWPANGISIASGPGNQLNPQIAADGMGGAIVTWADTRGADTDIYAQRIDRTGADFWQEDGLPVCVLAGQQREPRIVSDGAGGAVIVWEDGRPGALDIDLYGQRLDPVGNPMWGSGGAQMTGAAASQRIEALAADGAGNLIGVWNDERRGTVATDTYAQRLDGRYGEWGRPEPIAESALDLPSDEGGQVIVRWDASQGDRFQRALISHYSVWRSFDPPASAAERATAGTARVDPGAVGPFFSGRAVWVDESVAGSVYWEWVANQSAAFLPAYSAVVPTRADSVAGDPAEHAFKVLAHAPGTPARIWESNAAWGHSTDDLAPEAPLALVADRSGLDVRLTWTPVGAADLREYAIYRSAMPHVTPGPATFYATAAEAGAWDTSAPATALYYVVAAIDVHGNHSAPSNEARADYTLTAVDESEPPARLSLAGAQPNPLDRGTTLRFGLPHAARVSVNLLDVGGRRVRSADFAGAPGWQSVALDATDDAGRRLPSGVYVYVVAAGGETARGKLVVTR